MIRLLQILIFSALTLSACHFSSPSQFTQQVFSTGLAAAANPPTFNVADIPNPSGQWTAVASDFGGAETAVDARTAIYQGNFVRFWQRRVSPVPDLQRVSVYLNYTSMDCLKGVFRFHKDVYLDQSGNVVGQGVGNSAIQSIVPGSVAAQVFQFVCQPVNTIQ